ncbi:MAG: flagellar hook-associated protein FlgL [Candidatus Kuenenia sp.]|nr:flagellar hook-associated protein FlgL [Candidatus Kuenenia hertensis]
MSFRVTQASLSNTTLSNIQQNYKKMQEIQEKLSSGKNINRASDDPVSTRKLLGFKSEENELQQYLDAIKHAKDKIDFIFDALENIQEIMVKIQTKAVQAADGTLGDDERGIIASELDEFMETIIQFSNVTDSDGRYLFSGTKTTTAPFSATRDSSGEITAVSYNGNNETIQYQIGSNTFIQVNQPGGKLFMENSIFDTLLKLRDELKSSNFDTNTFLSYKKDFETANTNVLTGITKFGSKVDRLELTENRIENSKTALKELISYTEDADIAELITDLKNQENVLQAALQTGARVIQPTLLDFIG